MKLAHQFGELAFVSAESSPTAPARVEPLWAELPFTAPARVEPSWLESSSTAPARGEPLWAESPVTGPQQYQVQFSTTEEHVQLIERAKALLSRSAPGKSLGELHLEAMRLLVGSLEKQKFAMKEHPRATVCEPAVDAATTATGGEIATAPHSNGGGRSRHIPAAVRRAVYGRDSARCTFVDGRGERCRETRGLELHHREPFGEQGAHTAENVTLHCRTHNALAAELDFGPEHMAQRRQPERHESLAAARRAAKRRTSEPD